jgi:ribosomal RNA-processing protein 1
MFLRKNIAQLIFFQFPKFDLNKQPENSGCLFHYHCFISTFNSFEVSLFLMATTISNAAHPTAEDNRFARSLVNPEKSVRDKSLQVLSEHLSSLKAIEDLHMLKLWKALYYCMWLADKREVQEELAFALAGFIDGFRNHKLKLLYISTFFQIILREWSLLDMFRLNKFYFLIRVLVRKALEISYKKFQHNKPQFIEELNIMFFNEVLTKRPNGLRYHLADVIITELARATKGELTTEFFMLVISPFLRMMIEGDDTTVIERIHQSVFSNFLTKYARENMINKKENEEEKEPKEETFFFLQVDTRLLQAKLFDLASSPDTSNRYRSRLYTIHKQCAFVTKQDFIDINNLSSSPGEEQSATTTTTAVQPAATITTTSSHENTVKLSGKKRKGKNLVEQEEEEEPVVAVSENTKTEVIEQGQQQMKEGKKNKKSKKN